MDKLTRKYHISSQFHDPLPKEIGIHLFENVISRQKPSSVLRAEEFINMRSELRNCDILQSNLEIKPLKKEPNVRNTEDINMEREQ